MNPLFRVAAGVLFFLCSATASATVEVLAHPAGLPGTTASNGQSSLTSLFVSTVPPTIFSADGRYLVFVSTATDLTTAPTTSTNSSRDVFLRDRSTGTTTLVSHAVDLPTAEANDLSESPRISADGRFVAYMSIANDVVAGQQGPSGLANVFLFDRVTGLNTLVSHSSSSAVTTANDSSFPVGTSADGAFVFFQSYATDLVTGQVDTNLTQDLYLFDRALGTTMLVSHSASSPVKTGNDASYEGALSADGRYVAYFSIATDLEAGQVQSPQIQNVHLFDRMTGATTLVSHGAGTPLTGGGGHSFSQGISADGRFVLFTSVAPDLVAGLYKTILAAGDVYLWDRVTGSTSLVSHAPGLPLTTTGHGLGNFAAMSSDALWIVYDSFAEDAVAGEIDGNGAGRDVYLYDRAGDVTSLVSHARGSALTSANDESYRPVISGNGSRVAFLSVATDLSPSQTDANAATDVFVFDRPSGAVTLVSRAAGTAHTTAGAPSNDPVISPDGNAVGFDSDANDLVAVDTNGEMDAFLWSPVTLPVQLSFHPLVPCRVFDTRNPPGPRGGPTLAANGSRDFAIAGTCGVPSGAAAISANVTVTNVGASGDLRVYPSGTASPTATTLSLRAGRTRANNDLIAITGDPAGSLTVENAAGGTTDVLLDVNGYWK